MPSPIAHLGAGYVIYRYYKSKLRSRAQLWKFPFHMIMIMGLSLLPDLDIIAAMVFRDIENYHNNFSHSLVVAIPVALLVAAILRQIYHYDFWLCFLICMTSYDLHVIMDAMTSGRGVMMLWPLTETRFVSPITIFTGLHWGEGWFSIWHVWTILTESLFGLVIFLAIRYFDKRRNQTNTVIPSRK